jgi:hypothetical protein
MSKPMKSLKDFFVKFASIVDAGDNPEAKIPLFKSKEEKIENKGGGKNMTLEEILKGMDEEQKKIVETELNKIPDLAQANSELRKANDELETKVEELEKEEPAEDDKSVEEIVKSADPKIQEMLKKQSEELEKMKEDMEKRLEKEKIEKEELRKEEIKKEVEEFTNIGASKEDLVEIFSKIDSDKDLYDKVKTVLKADDEALKSSDIMVQVGSQKEPVKKSTEEELEDEAKKLVEKDGITIEKARSIVIKGDPDKYLK